MPRLVSHPAVYPAFAMERGRAGSTCGIQPASNVSPSASLGGSCPTPTALLGDSGRSLGTLLQRDPSRPHSHCQRWANSLLK